jgi:hypothetical protein
MGSLVWFMAQEFPAADWVLELSYLPAGNDRLRNAAFVSRLVWNAHQWSVQTGGDELDDYLVPLHQNVKGLLQRRCVAEAIEMVQNERELERDMPRDLDYGMGL